MAFQYPPLPDEDALRLLTLRGGEFFDPLEGELIPISFSSKPKYLSLSYTWGDPAPEQPDLPADFTNVHSYPPECQEEATLALNGHDVPIGHNLALALRYLRSPSHPLTLWVDAVCINQEDIDERNAQVVLMALIYSRAVAVVTWLGLNPPEVMAEPRPSNPRGINGQAAMTMGELYARGNSKELASWFADYVTTVSSAAARNQVEARAAEKERLERMAAVNQLGDTMIMASSYWQRVWVVQEVCLAQKVFFVYGPTLLVDEEALQSAHQTKALKVVQGMSSMLDARRTRFFESMRLEALIEEFAGQLCTDARDKIYGLVGLANDINVVEAPVAAETEDDSSDSASIHDSGDADVNFVVDYRRSFYSIWCDVVQYIFQCPYYFVPSHLDTDEDELSRLRKLRLMNVVRFSGLVQNTLRDEVERELTKLGTSSSAASAAAQLRGPKLFGHHLVPVQGYLAGKILEVGPSYADFLGSFRHQTAWRTKWRKHYRKENDLWQLREMEERYAAKLLELREADVARVARIDGDSFVAVRSPDEDGPLDKLTSAHTNKDDLRRVLDDLLVNLSIKGAPEIERGGKVFRFLGSDRCMGLAPPGADVGDWIIRFYDCDAAIVVRSDDASDPARSFSLIGRADVADLIDRKGRQGDTVASQALQRDLHGGGENKRVDILMKWRTLQLITASIAT